MRVRLRLRQGPAEVDIALQGEMRAWADRTEDGRLVVAVAVPGTLHLEVEASPEEAEGWIGALWRPAVQTVAALRRPDLRRSRDGARRKPRE